MSTVTTPVGILCFPSIFEPREPAPGMDKRHSLILLFDDLALQTAAYQNLRAAVQEAAADKWGAAKAQDANFMRSLRLPFRNAAEKDYAGFEKGTVFISPWSKNKPGIVDLKGHEIKVPGDVWAGQLARATVRAFGYEQSGNKGVSFGLEHVQIVKADAERIDGRRSADKAFEGADNSELARFGIDPNATTNAAATGDMPW